MRSQNRAARRCDERLQRLMADRHARGIRALRASAERRVRHVISLDIGPVSRMLADPETADVALPFLLGAFFVSEGNFVRNSSCACCDTRWAPGRAPVILALGKLDHVKDATIVLGVCEPCADAAGSADGLRQKILTAVTDIYRSSGGWSEVTTRGGNA